MKKQERHRFFYHYRRSTGGMTVHYRERCFPCKNVVCEVPTETKYNKQQPRVVVQGFAREIEVDDDTITIR